MMHVVAIRKELAAEPVPVEAIYQGYCEAKD